MRKLFQWLLCLVAFSLATSLPTSSLPAAEFKHPGDRYALTLPEGWNAAGFVNSWGYPYHLFSLDQPATDRGFRVFALPIAAGSKPTLESSVSFAFLLATAENAWITADLKSGRPAKLGSLDALVFSLYGNQNSEDWCGELQIVLGEEALYVVHVVAPAAEWEDVRTKYEGALSSFAVPQRLEYTRERPATAERPEDVDARIAYAVPQVLVLSRTNPADANVGNMVVRTMGSAVILTADGYAVTNRHVVERATHKSQDATSHRFAYDPVWLRWTPETKLEGSYADVVAVSYAWDLALLKIRGDRTWNPVPMADPRLVRRTQRVLVAGWPGLDFTDQQFFTVNTGDLTAIHSHLDGKPGKYQHSARTTGGNSGGLLYDLDLGAMIGVHSEKLLGSYQYNSQTLVDVVAHGAVPIDRVFEEFPQLTDDPAPEHQPVDVLAARIASFYLARRPTAALLECDRLLREDSQSGVANIFKFRILSQQGEPESVTKPLYFAAVADPATRELAEFWRARASLENEDWEELETILGSKVLSDVSLSNETLPQSLLNLFEAEMLQAYSGGDFARLEIQKQHLAGASAEAEVMTAVGEIRNWMLEKKVTSLPSVEQPSPEQVRKWREQLAQGLTMWPSFHEMAMLYSAYLDAALGQTETADAAFQAALKSGRRDQFFLSNALYYCLLRKHGIDAYWLASEIHSEKSPGTHFMLGQTLCQVAVKIRKVDMKIQGEAKEVQQIALTAQARGWIPENTPLDSVADAFESAGQRIMGEGLVRIHRGRVNDDLESSRHLSQLPLPQRRLDLYWGPFVYLQQGKDWVTN